MFDELQPILVQRFDGGINKSTTVDNIQDNELDECLNMNLNPDGSLTSRSGVDQYNSTLTGASRITSIYYAQIGGGGAVSRIVTTLAKVYKDDTVGGWTDITGPTAPPSNTLWMWRTFNNLAIGVNGSTVPQKHTPGGGACADLTGSPPDKCKAIEINQGRVYLANDGDEPTAIHGCAAGNSGDWTTANDAFKIYVDKDNGYGIVGLAKFFGEIIILKRKGIYKLYNPTNSPTDMQVIQIFDDVGCISPYSIKQIGNELVWLDDDGVYTMQATQNFGDVAYASISKKVQPYIDDVQLSLLGEACGTDIRKLAQYRICLPKSQATQNNHTIIRDYLHAAWIRHEGINFASFGKWSISDLLYDMAGGYDGKVYKIDRTHEDEGANFTKNVKSKRFNFGTSQKRKWFHRVYQEFQTGGAYSIGFTADIDYNRTSKASSLVDSTAGDDWDTAQWDVGKWGGQSVQPKTVNVGMKGRNVQCQWLNSVKNQPFTLFKFEISASLLGRRG